MNLLLGPALRLVLSPADLRSLDVTVLHQRGPAHLRRLVEGDLLVLDEAALPEVLIAVLLLLGLVLSTMRWCSATTPTTGGATPPTSPSTSPSRRRTAMRTSGRAASSSTSRSPSTRRRKCAGPPW